MATYKCKKEGCNGDVVFHNPPDTTQSKREDTCLIVVKDRPAECSKCGTSYYEHEFQL